MPSAEPHLAPVLEEPDRSPHLRSGFLLADDDDLDSDTSSLLTLTPSLRAELYRINESRRYQAVNTDYPLPCDGVAARAELLIHQIYGKTWEGGCWEPEQGLLDRKMASGVDGEQRRMLDVGSGTTASWAMSMAQRFPDASVIGVDLIPSDLPYVPPNLDLEIHDVLEGLPYPDDFFTLIHCRELTCLSRVYSLPFFNEVARVLRPGGILLIEEVEADSLFNLPPPPPGPQPLDPRFQLVQDRCRHHLATVLDNLPGGRGPPDPKFRAAKGPDNLRLVEGFDHDGAVRVTRPVFGVGVKEGEEGPKEEQRGWMVREALLCAWSMGAAMVKNASAAWMREVAELDEAIVPEEDIGVTIRSLVVWAERR